MNDWETRKKDFLQKIPEMASNRYSISKKEFSDIWSRFERDYDLAFNHLSGGYILNTILYLAELEKLDFSLVNLIHEIKESQSVSVEQVYHAYTLTQICYQYTKYGYSLKVLRTHHKESRPDLLINEITCDLKVRNDQHWKTMQQYFHLLDKDPEKYHKISSSLIKSPYQDLTSALENRASKGFFQADCIILDLSNHFHTWNYHRRKKDGLPDHPLKPIKDAIIIFMPDNAGRSGKNDFSPQALWGYVFGTHIRMSS